MSTWYIVRGFWSWPGTASYTGSVGGYCKADALGSKLSSGAVDAAGTAGPSGGRSAVDCTGTGAATGTGFGAIGSVAGAGVLGTGTGSAGAGATGAAAGASAALLGLDCGCVGA